MTVSHPPLQRSVPSTIRETFELFAFFRSELGIDSLVASLPIEGVTPRQVYYAAHGRPPDSISTATLVSGITGADVYIAALKSAEFRQNFVARFLEAFEDKKRLLFIHVPKCAGSDLSSHLISRFPSLNSQILDPDWASSDQFFAAIRDVVLEVNVSDSIYVHGHNNLAFYRKWELIRFQDEIFTVLRDPVSRVISQVNYVLTRVFSEEVPIAPDTRGWRDEFGIDDNQLAEAKAAVHELARRSLRDEGVVVPNIICQYLGRGTCDSAIEQTVINDIEITETSRYDAWSRARWKVGQPTRRNVSDTYVRFTEFLGPDQEYIREICSEDLKLYRLLTERLQQSDSLSIKGEGILPSRASVVIAAPRAVGCPNIGGTEAVEPAQPAAEISEKATAGAKKMLTSCETAPWPIELTSHGAPEPEFPLRELMLHFESLGENCEFGLVQRRCGADPVGLFRFASAPLPKLIAALDARFEGLGEPANLKVQLSPNGREYLVTDKRFELLYHAWVMADEMTAEEVHRREVRRLPLLIRKLSEDLSQAEKIFVYHGMEPLSSQHAGDLLARLRAYGPNTLLWVELADAEHRPGAVEWCGDGLLKGYIDRFAPSENAHDLSLDYWIEICSTACRMMAKGAM